MKGTFILSNKWDIRFLEMAKLVASWSKDPSTQVGAIAVRNRNVIAQGYNGFPRGVDDHELYYLNRAIKYKRIVHAEMNAILNAAENGVSLKGSVIYVIGLPICHDCAKGLIQVGIKRVVTPEIETPERWLESLALTEQMFEEAGIVWNKIKY